MEKIQTQPKREEKAEPKREQKVNRGTQNSPITKLKPSESEIALKYKQILECRNQSDRQIRQTLKELRYLILKYGVPCNLRPNIWKILLGVYQVDAHQYISLIQKGESSQYEKIANDCHRTMASDLQFVKTVSITELERILNAFVWKAESRPPARLSVLKYGYVQGMNVLLAPILFSMPELDSFFTFTNLIVHQCPLYVQPALEGVHCGVKLVEKCLLEFDSDILDRLVSCGIEPTVFAFPWIMTLSAAIPPLQETLLVWDYLLAYGVHLNVLVVTSLLITNRATIINSTNTIKVLRELRMDSSSVLKKTMELVEKCPDDLYDLLVRHVYDATIYETLFPSDAW